MTTVRPAELGTVTDVLRAEAARNDTEARLSARTVAALREADLFAAGLPVEHGGVGGSAADVFDLVVRLAEADAAAGWVVGTCAVGKRLATLVFGGDAAASLVAPAAPVCGSGHPTGTVQDRDRRLVLDGRWSWLSGCDVAEAAIVGAVRPGSEPGASMAIAVAPMATGTVVDDWDTPGMRGTGSRTVVFEEVPILAEQVGSFAFDMTFPAYSAATVAAPVIGAALGAARLGRELLGQERPVMGGGTERVGDSPAARMMVTTAVQLSDTALVAGRAACAEIDEAGAELTPAGFAAVRAGFADACRNALAAFEPLLDVAGASVFRSGDPISRLWRDASVGARHPLINSAVAKRGLADSLG